MIELDFHKLLDILKNENISIGEYTLRQEIINTGTTREAVLKKMRESLEVMKTASTAAANAPLTSVSGLTGGNAYKYAQYQKNGDAVCGGVVADAIRMSLSCSEVNASMQRIVACPTAGSCGIVPAALISVASSRGKSENELLMALFTAAGVGLYIGEHATLSGAEGGCQAECGSATAMAGAAITELCGGTPEAAFHAGAIALKNSMGLICDPVAGLVEIPCIKRNASGAVGAIICADMALAGVESYIPFDEVVAAMFKVGNDMPESLRETALGGLAVTPTGLKMKEKVTVK